MSFLPDFNPDFKKLHELIYKSIQGRLLISSLELKIFDHLADPVTAEALAEKVEVPSQRCRILLDALVSCGYAQKTGESYSNTTLSQRFLATDGAAYLGGLLVQSWKMVVDPLEDLTRVLKQGFEHDGEEDLGREELWAKMAHANAQYARAGLAQLAVEQMSSLKGFDSITRMLDLGGGPGLVAMALAEANPNLEAVILDQPAVVKVAQEYIDKYGLADRVSVMGADYSKDDIGREYDLVWASATLNFHRKDLASIFEKIYRAINPGGVFACFQDGLTHQGTKPREMVLGFLGAALRSGMKSFAQGEIAQAMLDAGFTRIRSRTLDTDCGPMDLDLGFKP